MIEREYEALIQDLLDGQASPKDIERLEAWLAGSEDGRTRRRELEGVFHALEQVPSVEAPEDLRDRVLETLQTRAPGRAASRRGTSGAGLRTLFGQRLRLAYVLAAGIAAGALGMGALTGVLPTSGPGRDPSVSGTMMPAAPPTSGAVRLQLSAGEARLEAVAWRVGKARFMTVEVRGGEPAEIELEFDPGALSLRGVRRGSTAWNVRAQAGRVVLGAEQSGYYTLELNELKPDSPALLSLRAGGHTVAGVLAAP